MPGQKELKLNNGAVLRNRFVMAPMNTYAGDPGGFLTEAEIEYFRRRGTYAGAVITGASYTIESGCGLEGQFSAADDKFLPGLTKAAQAIKQHGAKAILQLYHAGRMVNLPVSGPDKIGLGPSPVAAPREGSKVPKELTEAEIEEIMASFQAAVRRAVLAGFDGVEIHGANTYLIQQFFSPHSNRRTDRWGGSREKRALFPMTVIDKVKETAVAHANPEFIIGYRLSPEELEEPGLTLDDTLYLSDLVAGKGLQYLHLSMGQRFDQSSIRDASDKRATGRLVRDTLRGRLPLIGGCGVFSLEEAEKAFELYDIVYLGRAILINPFIPKTLMTGEWEIVRSVTPREAEAIDLPPGMVAHLRSVDTRSWLIKS